MIVHSVVLLALLTLGLQESVAQARSDNANSAGTLGSKAPSSASNDSTSKANSAEARAEAKRYYKTGVKFGRAKLFEQAAASFLQAIRLNPNFGDAYYGLGHAFFDLKRWHE
ncbi:MAG: tetratricopeptide repeat protein [Pyrinomonadaceae bacterium]